MRQIAPRVYIFDGLPASNVYLLASEAGLALVDTGMAWGVRSIVTQLEAGGFKLSDLRTIVLTHAHGDHVGGLPGLLARSNAEVWAYRDEVPYVEGRQALPATTWLQRLMGGFGPRRAASAPHLKVSRALADGAKLQRLGDLQVIHVPGHTPGSLCLYQPEQKLLFCGDVLAPKRQGGDIRLDYAPAFFCADPAQARETVRRLSGLPVEVLCPGHGQPVLHGADDLIRQLLEKP